jgi:hypothetical protein
MGTKYTSQTETGYNAAPPPDDGSTGANNLASWADVKTKLGDPTLTLAQNINTALTNALDFSSRTTAVNDTATSADHMKTIECTAAITVKAPTSATVGAGFVISYKNTSAVNVTVGLQTATDTLDGVVNGTFVLLPEQALVVKSNLAGTGYYSISGYFGAAGGGSLSCTTLTANGLITANAGITSASGQVITGNASTGTTSSSAIVGNASTSGTGIYGISSSGKGVNGTSTTGYGVYGEGSGVGVYGTSSGSYGVQGIGVSAAGVYGTSTSQSGVYGTSTSGIGAYGISTSNVGLYGTSSTGSPLQLSVSAAAPTTSLSNGCISIGNTTGSINVYIGGAWVHVTGSAGWVA